ncbi:NfeD family protein [Microbacteriaceae bacterium VKM Ac-2855]|nr:NfeD family protein [Microbacteriaceae bacterium VKM Ac-2855]
MTIFLVVGGIGVVLLLASVVIGDHIESIGDGALSGTALGIAAVLFGGAGVVTSAAEWSPVAAYGLAGLAAVGSYFGVRGITRGLVGSSDGGPVDVVGLRGIATATITVEGGEVSLDGPREVERRLAYSEEPIPPGTRIRVIEMAGTRVKVERESFGV